MSSYRVHKIIVLYEKKQEKTSNEYLCKKVHKCDIIIPKNCASECTTALVKTACHYT